MLLLLLVLLLVLLLLMLRILRHWRIRSTSSGALESKQVHADGLLSNVHASKLAA